MMINKGYENKADNAINEQAEKLLTQRPGSKANVPIEEVTHMPFGSEYNDSARADNPEHFGTLQPIGALVAEDLARLVAQFGGDT